MSNLHPLVRIHSALLDLFLLALGHDYRLGQLNSTMLFIVSNLKLSAFITAARSVLFWHDVDAHARVLQNDTWYISVAASAKMDLFDYGTRRGT